MSTTDPYAAPEKKQTQPEPEPEQPVEETQPEPTTESATQEEDLGEGVPVGTINAILDWVGDDKERAQAALDKEEAAEDPRVTLIRQLKEILNG